VWFISCGQLYEACAEGAAAFKDASAKLGWNTTIVDGKADPSVASAAIRQAAAAGVDGVALVAFDCPAIKAALAEAKKDKMPVVQSFSYDCGDPGIPGPPLFAASLKAKGLPLSQYRIDWGKARADYAIAKTKGTAKVISLEEQSQFTSKAANQGFDDQIATCPKCKMVDQVKWTFADVPNGTFTAKVLAALRQHPEATALSVPGDAFFSLGVSQALKQSGKAGKIMVIGGEGFAPNVKLIRDGVQTASMAYDYSWAAYGLADVLNRVFAGTPSASMPDEGGGWQVMDKDNNLPAAGQKWQAPVDYKAAFDKVWGG
jgi:ribose transport system substrate-binding protein